MTLAEARSGAGGLGQKSTAASADLGIRLCLALVALLLLFRVLLAATADLSEDEAYYWLWSTHLAAGYYDHPPMIAYWIRAGTAVFGQTGFGVRFAALLSSLAGSYVLYRASLSLFGDRNAALLAVLWLNATLFCNAAAIIATPDTPLAFFAIRSAVCLGEAHRNGAWRLVVRVGRSTRARLHEQIHRSPAPARHILMDDRSAQWQALVPAARALFGGRYCGGHCRAGVLLELHTRLGLVCQAGSTRHGGQARQCVREHCRAGWRAGGPCDAHHLRLLRVGKLFRAPSRLETAGFALASTRRLDCPRLPFLSCPFGQP